MPACVFHTQLRHYRGFEENAANNTVMCLVTEMEGDRMTLADLQRYSRLFSSYTELRVQENRSLGVTFVKGNNVGNSRSTTGGVSARVYRAGSWGLASNPEIADDSIASVIRAAADNAEFLSSRQEKRKGPLPAVAATHESSFATKKPRLTQGQLVDFVREIDDHIVSKYPSLQSRTVILNCLDMEKAVVTSDGSAFTSLTPRAIVVVVLCVERSGEPVELYQVYGGLGQFEDLFESPSGLFRGIEEQYEHLISKSEGVHADAGTKTCILHADLAGILAHEAIGHTTEADIVLGGSVAAHLIGHEVASPLVTLVDYANTALGQTCPVPVYVDDEGTKAEDVVIIEEGVLKSYMHNKESANHFNMPLTGNARAYQFSDEPLIRMRNTAILRGTSKLEDMIASVDDGYDPMRSGNGQADSTSEFMFGVVLGYEIKNGKLGRAIKDTTISGVAYDVLKTVSMVSDEMHWSNAGMCGKKQPIPVGMGGPAVKCTLSIGGR